MQNEICTTFKSAVGAPLLIIGEVCLNSKFTAVDQPSLSLGPTRMDTSTRTECLARARGDLLEAIGSWVFLWPERVYGLAGSGKTTVATTTANFFREHRLGAFVFCDRDIAEKNDPSNVIRNIAYRLALFDIRIRHAIELAIDNLPSIAESPLRLEFDKLLLEPLLNLPDY